MKSYRYIKTAFYTLLAMFALAGFIEAQQKTPPPPGKRRPVNLPKSTEKKLSNGLTVVLSPLRNVPKITALLSFHTGQSAGREQHPGIAQLAAAVANEGTDTRSSQAISEELRSIGGTLSLGTDFDSTIMSASSLSEFSGKLFVLMGDVAQHASFPEKELALAKENMIQGIQEQRADPNFLATEQFQKAVFGNHPYSFVVADDKSITALTRDNLKDFVKGHYLPNNDQLVIVGDFHETAVMAEIEKSFGSWASVKFPQEETPALPQRDKRQIYFVNRPGSIQSTIVMGNSIIPRKDPDYFAIRTADTIYGGSFYSRLTKNIRETKGYTYSPFSTAFTMAKSGYFQTGAAVRNEVTGPTLLEMLYELDKMRVTPVTQEELDAAKAYSTGNFSIQLSSQSGLASRINTVYTYELPKDFIESFRVKIDDLTISDIQKAAAKYFDTYHGAIVIVGDYEKVKDQVKPFGDITLMDAEGKPINQKPDGKP